MARRPSPQTKAVLLKLLSDPDRWHYGYDVVQDLDMPSGTVYPILMRLHERDVLETRWEESPIEGRPRRHMYRLTRDGRSWARSVTTEQRKGATHPSLGTT